LLVSPLETRPVWLLVRTKPKQERAAEEFLCARDVETYCPRALEWPSHARAPRNPVPLFTGYLFTHCVLNEAFHTVAFCPGGAGPVRFVDRLAAVSEADVELLRRREMGRGYIDLKSMRRLPVDGSRVQIVGGPLRGMAAIVEKYLPSQERVRLLLKVVSGTWRAQMAAEYVRDA
jgi:transcription antitermination factor NusG